MSMSLRLSHEEDGSGTRENENNKKQLDGDGDGDGDGDDDDNHENDTVMPGFRFHPTEEELVEFYLRRKVEGKRFNVELITFLDLYRYDPWELPALAAIGEKEWYFYVPRDRKYRNGDRPNRVTTSGYWKATGADRMIRTENFRSIGLKKTLVFYSGKAPKGIRTSWIMNEYRLPQHETERYQKAEISLCRVYKRAGVEDHPSLPRCLPITKPAASRSSSKLPTSDQNITTTHHHHLPHNMNMGLFLAQSKHHQDDQIQNHLGTRITTASASDHHVTTDLGLSKYNAYHCAASVGGALISTTMGEEEEEGGFMIQQQSNTIKQPAAANSNSTSLVHTCFPAAASSNNNNNNNLAMMDDLNRLLSYQPGGHLFNVHQSHLLMPPMSLITSLPNTTTLTPANANANANFWDWNPIPADQDHPSNISMPPFK